MGAPYAQAAVVTYFNAVAAAGVDGQLHRSEDAMEVLKAIATLLQPTVEVTQGLCRAGVHQRVCRSHVTSVVHVSSSPCRCLHWLPLLKKTNPSTFVFCNPAVCRLLPVFESDPYRGPLVEDYEWQHALLSTSALLARVADHMRDSDDVDDHPTRSGSAGDDDQAYVHTRHTLDVPPPDLSDHNAGVAECLSHIDTVIAQFLHVEASLTRARQLLHYDTHEAWNRTHPRQQETEIYRHAHLATLPHAVAVLDDDDAVAAIRHRLLQRRVQDAVARLHALEDVSVHNDGMRVRVRGVFVSWISGWAQAGACVRVCHRHAWPRACACGIVRFCDGACGDCVPLFV